MPANVIQRNQNWVDGEVLYADVLDDQFDKIYDLLNGTDLVNGVYIRTNGSQNALADPALLINGQFYIETSTNGAVINIYKIGDTSPRISISNLGSILLRAGSSGATPSDQLMYASGCLYNRSTNIGNVGAGEDDLTAFTVGKNVFASGGAPTFINVRYRGYTAANGNNKRLKFYGKTTVLMDSDVMTENDKPWFLDAEIMQDADGISTVTIAGIFKCGATEVRFNSQLTGYDFSVDNVWKMTAEAVADNDLVNNMMIIDVGRGIN